MKELQNVKRRIRDKVRSMSHQEIHDWLISKASRKSDNQALVREISGGYFSQSLDAYICQQMGSQYRK